jgi:isoleucyl-tRNA synthetase
MSQARVDAFQRLTDVTDFELANITCDHPLRAHGYDFDVPLLDGEHVDDETGTGFVHTAPGHGTEDFDIWIEYKARLDQRGIDTAIPYTVGPDGAFTADAPGFEGARVIDDEGGKGDANERVIEALIEAGMLIARGRLRHQYPHSWRSKKPVIFRNTPQWFISMQDGEPDGLRARALRAIDETRFVPKSGQTRLRSMIENRPDWVISRQRAWGVPITVFVHRESREVIPNASFNGAPELIRRITDAFAAEGADAWFAEGAKERFLSGLVSDPGEWEKIDDILDVWFESGSTHRFVLETRADLKWPADVYLEGTDQHRGWFHSSLLESAGTRGRAPYGTVVTHGFTMDEDGRKMSKSLGNITAPQDVIRQYGADILRLWVVLADYAEDQRIGPDILKSTVDAYRKLRNTLRWLLGNLHHFREDERVGRAAMPELERYVLHRLAELDRLVRTGYRDFDYKRISSALFNFATIDLSAFYFDIRKDALYCDPPSSLRRRAALTVLDEVFSCLTAWLAPMLVFTIEDVWRSRFGEDARSVHLRQFPQVPEDCLNPEIGGRWSRIRQVRRVITGALEVERREKRIGSSLEAAPVVYVDNELLMESVSKVDLAEIAITSQLELEFGPGPADAFRMNEVLDVAVVPKRAEGRKCARSWKILPDVGSDPAYPDLSARDAAAMREIDAAAKRG